VGPRAGLEGEKISPPLSFIGLLMVSIHCMLSVRNFVGGCSVKSESSGEPIIAHAVVVAILEYEGY
jgi:hypothetical protein